MHCPYFVDFLELPGTFRCTLRASTTFPEIGDTAVDGTEFENQRLSALAPSEGDPRIYNWKGVWSTHMNVIVPGCVNEKVHIPSYSGTYVSQS